MRVYVANPLGFSEAGRVFLYDVLVRALETAGLVVIEPFRSGNLDSFKVEGEALIDAVGRFNAELLDSCDMVVAVLDGVDIDSGTAAEIGYAFARGKRIIGYRGDLRRIGDLPAATVNCQVEYFIRASGGRIVKDVPLLVSEIGRVGK